MPARRRSPGSIGRRPVEQRRHGERGVQDHAGVGARAGHLRPAHAGGEEHRARDGAEAMTEMAAGERREGERGHDAGDRVQEPREDVATEREGDREEEVLEPLLLSPERPRRAHEAAGEGVQPRIHEVVLLLVAADRRREPGRRLDEEEQGAGGERAARSTAREAHARRAARRRARSRRRPAPSRPRLRAAADGASRRRRAPARGCSPGRARWRGPPADARRDRAAARPPHAGRAGRPRRWRRAPAARGSGRSQRSPQIAEPVDGVDRRGPEGEHEPQAHDTTPAAGSRERMGAGE